MARPAMRDPSGRWSLAQVAAAAGLSRQTARTVVSAGYLNPEDLHYKDIALAKVAAALIDAPRPAGMNRHDAADAITKRNFEALTLARRLLDDPTPSRDAILRISATEAVFHKSPSRALADLEDLTEPALMLPLGAWVTELNSDLITGRRASE